ncbi:MAG TPA: metalloregulator ArsR/SmtB family transcription factor [Acidimicrobiales bacterium]|jgi:DNA-binding transcriptional ArsR family regulator|nr:metalloregulator ArsR/SmtB family transcription factor [Acidimicrobiales bacterium]
MAREPSDAVFAALADPTRRSILRAVAERGPVTATALSDGLPISRQAVAKHLGLLRHAGLVVADRAGRETQFVAVGAPLDDLAAWAEQTSRRWDDRLARLRERLGERRALQPRGSSAGRQTRDRPGGVPS